MADQKVYSQIQDPEFNLDNEVQAMVDHFSEHVPDTGGEMGKVMNFLEARPWVHQNDWKSIYELALKKSRDVKKH